MTRETNFTIIVKVVDLDMSCIYSHKHMAGMSKISFSECGPNISVIVLLNIQQVF